MEPQLHSDFNPQQIFDLQKNQLMELTEKMIETELGITELTLSLGSLDGDLEKAHKETESFKKETLEKAKKLAKENNTSVLSEYKKLLNFI